MLPLPKNSSLFCQLLAGQACLSHRYVSFRYFMQIHISRFSLLNLKLNWRDHISTLSRSADCQWHWKVGLSRLVRSIASAQCAVQLLTQHSAVQKRTFWQRCETGSARAVRCWSPIQLQRCKKWQAWQACLCCVFSQTVFSLKKEWLCNITFYSQSISSRCSYAEVRPKTHESCIIGFMISNIVTKMKYQSWTADLKIDLKLHHSAKLHAFWFCCTE